MPKATRNRVADTRPDLEPDSSDAAFRANQAPYFNRPVRISIHHRRARLADIDGLSVKYIIDSLVAANVLTDDSAQQVAEVRNYQSKGSPETTRIVIEEL